MQPSFQNNLVDEPKEINQFEIDYQDQEMNHLECVSYIGYLTRFGY